MISDIEKGSEMLKHFGLTPYQSKVYLAVVKLGLSTASRIVKTTGIRREEVYRTLPKLEEAGLIERILGRPVRVRALPVEEALSILIRRKQEESEKEILELTSKREEFLESMKDIITPVDVDENQTHFILTSDKDSVHARVLSSLSNAKEEINIVETSQNLLHLVLTYSDALADRSRKGIVIRIVSDCPENPTYIPTTLEEHIPNNNVLLRYSDEVSSGYIIIDQREAILTTSTGRAKTDNRRLWTDDPSLVEILQRDFEDRFRSSAEWHAYQISPSEKISHILDELKPREHVILVYNTLEAKRQVLFSYIQAALENDEAARYVCSEESTHSIRKAMREFGIDVDRHEETGALGVLDYTEIYIKAGGFNIDDVMEKWSSIYSDSLDKGFSGMRVTGEMQCFLDNEFIEELIEYEKALQTVLDIPMIAICAYNAQKLQKVDNPINIYYELVKAHGRTLYIDRDNRIGEIEIRV